MTREEFAALRVGQAVWVVGRVVVCDEVTDPGQMVRAREVTGVGGHADWVVVGSPGLGFARHDCYLAPDEARREAYRRIDLFAGRLAALRAAVAAEGGGA